MTQQSNPTTSSADWVSRFPIYYGWVILGAGTLGIIMTSPGQTFIVQAFIEEFIGDLGLSRTLVSTLYMIGTLANAALLQLIGIGRMIDRRPCGPFGVIVAPTTGHYEEAISQRIVDNYLHLIDATHDWSRRHLP